MNLKATKELYAQFLLATQERYSAVWLSYLLNNKPAHDAFTRWLSEIKLRPHILWEYAKPLVDLKTGVLIIDDTVLDKWYADSMDLVYSQYSGTHHRIVKGIGVVNLLWNSEHDPEEAEHIPCDFRVYAPRYDGKNKNMHCRDLLTLAKQRGFIPRYVLMDAWYADVKTFLLIRSFRWTFVSGIESNRKVSLVPHHHVPVADIATEDGMVCHLRAFDFVKVFKLVRPNGDIEYLATNDLSLSSPDARMACARRWKIEEYHRGTKQVTGMERCQARNQRAQRNHILSSIISFLALEKWRLETGCSWYETKQSLIAHCLSEYLRQPFIPFSKVLA